MSEPQGERRNRKRRQTDDAPSDVAVFERTLPHNLEAERAVLGAILLHNDAYITAARHLRAADFMRDAHRRIYEALTTLLEKPNASVDLLTLKEEMVRRGDIEEVGGPSYLSTLLDGVPRSTNVGEYAKVVKEKSLLRAIIYTSNKLLTEAYAAEEPASTILNMADAAIVQLQHGTTSGRMVSIRQSGSALFDRLEHRFQHQGEITGVATGFASIDEMTLGWQPSDIIVLAARPSMGKTAFVMNLAVAAAMSTRADGTARHVAIFSLEMRRAPIEDRMLAALSGVPLTAIMRGWLYDAHWPLLTQAIGQIAEMNLHIDDAASRTVWDIRAECRRLRAEHGLDLVIIDYFQLMTATLNKKGATRTEELSDMSRRLKLLADELACPIILLSQLKRTGGSRPTLEDLRECGALEQDADLVAFLHRKDHRVSGHTEFLLSKQRMGATGTANLSFNRDTQRFEDGGEAPPEQVERQSAEDAQHAKTKAIIRSRARKRDRAEAAIS